MTSCSFYRKPHTNVSLSFHYISVEIDIEMKSHCLPILQFNGLCDTISVTTCGRLVSLLVDFRECGGCQCLVGTFGPMRFTVQCFQYRLHVYQGAYRATGGGERKCSVPRWQSAKYRRDSLMETLWEIPH